jgi:hypothetical protein
LQSGAAFLYELECQRRIVMTPWRPWVLRLDATPPAGHDYCHRQDHLTGAALLARVAAYRAGAVLGDAEVSPDHDDARLETCSFRRVHRAGCCGHPFTTAGILVLHGYLDEQQRGGAGPLDRPTRAKDLAWRRRDCCSLETRDVGALPRAAPT